MAARKLNKKDGVDDLVLMETVSEESIVENLQKRFKKSEIYTYIGPVLLSVNPFQTIRNLYGPTKIQQYCGRYAYELKPHVYAVAETTYRNLLSAQKNQCVLVSGESGAGKTEAAKKLLEYITAVSGSSRTGQKNLKEQLLRSNPVLESFGNAKTSRNDNSSRFGKYMQIMFDYGGAPTSASITNYLLEKPRVVGPADGERNYHIFYQLIAGQDFAEEQYNFSLQLPGPGTFAYLASSSCTRIQGVNDGDEFCDVVGGMNDVGLQYSAQISIFKIIAGILWLGNISFGDRGSQDGDAKVSTLGPLENAASYFGVDPLSLQKAVTNRTVNAGTGSFIRKPLNGKEAAETRDALAKALYSRTFSRLVQLINEQTRHQDGYAYRELEIGILDIFGFEIFETNSFEQLCINYCNEKLQQVFVELTLRAEQEEYSSEGIAWTPVNFFNNKVVCELIERKRPAGILAYLDEECIYPQANDQSLLKKLDNNLRSHAHFVAKMGTGGRGKSGSFVVKHFAGDVTYSVNGFLDKNKDTLYGDLINLMAGSNDTFIAELFPDQSTKKRPPTAGYQFRQSMQRLVKELMACEPHYIRCI